MPNVFRYYKLLLQNGIRCIPEKNLETIKAEKSIMNCSLNALSAIERKTFFELFENKKTSQIIDDLFDESYNVLSKKFELKDREVLRNIFYNITKTMKHYSSTYQDAIFGKKTEIDFLNTYIIELGKKYNVPTPMNEKIVTMFYEKFKSENKNEREINNEMKFRLK